MPADPSSPTAPRELLGRAEELTTLSRHLGLDDAMGATALLAGDAGMGKTRLLTELAALARASGCRVLVGHCLDFADQLLPYLPFTEMVGRLADEDPDVARAVAAVHPAITALAPGRRLMSGAEPGTADGSWGIDRIDRAAIFAGVHAALEELAAGGPLLVVVEDLHWADQSTRDLLSFLFTRPFREPVSFVGSYRSDDLHRRHPLRAAVAEWGRLTGVLRMQLAPLPDDVVGTLVRSLHRSLQGGPIAEREVAWIVERAEGNAFFAEELVGTGGMSRPDGSLPENLADLLLVRIDQLDDAGRRVVRAAACAGRRVTHELLSAVVELTPDALESGLRAAVESHVLVPGGQDSYAFRHALLAEAVYGDLLPGERVRLHGRYVEALTQGTVEGAAAELAMHARAAHDVDTAVRAGVRAGEEAMSVGGPDDAAKHFEAALELLARPSTEVPDGVDLVALVQRASDAVIATGHPARAMALVSDHLAQAGPAGRGALTPRDRAKLLLAWAGAAVVYENREDPATATAEALSLIAEEPGRLRTRALSLHARCLAEAGRDEEAAKYASEALAMAQRFDLNQVASEAATTLATLDGRLGDADSASRALDLVVETARSEGDTVAEMRGRFQLALIELEQGRLARAQELFRQAAAAAADSGRPWAPYGFDARYQQAMTAVLRGRWDEAMEVADPTGESPPADLEALLLSVRMLVAAGRGDDSALAHYDRLRPVWSREALIAVNSGAAAIELLGRQGDLSGVWRVHDEVVAAAGASWHPEFQARVRLSALVLGQLADQVARRPGPERAEVVVRADELVAVIDRIHRRAAERPRGFGPEGRAWVARGCAEHLRLRWLAAADVLEEAELVAAWERAAEAFATLGSPYELARSQARLASVLVACGRLQDAAPLVDDARAVADQLGAAPLQAELASLGVRPTRAGTGRTARLTRAASGELTPREVEILSLVAEGRTNGEIARRLFISTKTVSVHVSNILAKLGAAGRTEAAALARQRGLVGG